MSIKLWQSLLPLILLLLSCKSTSRSKLDAIFFSDGNRSFFVHYEGSTFFINSCALDAAAKVELEASMDSETIKAKCRDTITVIPPMALKDGLSEELMGTASDDLIGTKANRISQLTSQVADFKKSIDDLTLQMNDITFEEVLKAMAASLAEAKTNLLTIDSELKLLNAAKDNPEALKKIDINSTLSLQSKIATNADDQAAIFTAMLREVKVYPLIKSRDSILIKVLEKFNVTCSKDAAIGVQQSVQTGIETVTYECLASGNPKIISTTCALEGYERLDNYCIFTGKGLKLHSLASTYTGVCGASNQGVLTCWGKPGEFPMNARTFTETTSTLSRNLGKISTKIAADRVAASGTHLCTIASDGTILRCIENVSNIPTATTSFSQIIGGLEHFCGITSNKTVECWGTGVDFSPPPSELANIASISTTDKANCAIDENKKLTCWGKLNSFDGEIPATPPSDIGETIAVSVGTMHICAILNNKTVRCWGSNRSGQSTVPNDLKFVRLVASGAYETCAVTTNNLMKCWGRDTSGAAYSPGPALTDVQRLYTSKWGSNFCAVYGSQAKVACWGSLIYNDTVYDITPPSDLTQVKDIVITGNGYACAVQTSGAVRCWGNTIDVPATVPDAFKVKLN